MWLSMQDAMLESSATRDSSQATARLQTSARNCKLETHQKIWVCFLDLPILSLIKKIVSFLFFDFVFVWFDVNKI